MNRNELAKAIKEALKEWDKHTCDNTCDNDSYNSERCEDCKAKFLADCILKKDDSKKVASPEFLPE